MSPDDCDQQFPLHREDTRERDACALICSVRKGGQATHGNVKRTIEALTRMGHRTGIVDGEGDGVGIMTDIPRELWSKSLASRGLRYGLAVNPNFWVAHLMIPMHMRSDAEAVTNLICQRIQEAGLEPLYDGAGKVKSNVLGRSAEKNEPLFWQFAGMNGAVPTRDLEKTIYKLQTSIERELGVHFASFSPRSVVYKVQGTVEILRRYYPELQDTEYASTVTLGHARYSTNTNPVFERAQPFNVLGHNGEFNTISRFRLEAAMLGIDLSENNSDSQDVDNLIDALCMKYDFDLIEAMEYVFPPFEHDLIQGAEEIREMYENVRRAFGPFAQGPAAVAARVGDQCVFSVDALGLRPLWFGETEKEYFATSERGVYPLTMMSSAPKPLAPGEKIALVIKPGRGIEVLDYPAIQQHVFNRSRERGMFHNGKPRGIWAVSSSAMLPTGNGNGNGNGSSGAAFKPAPQFAPVALAVANPLPRRDTPINAVTMAALGWERYHLNIVETMAESNKELIGSLGWDGPLAAISHTRVNVADFFKEVVAVVTNPAIDREREQAQFSTTVYVGARPEPGQSNNPDDLIVALKTPLLLGGHSTLGSDDDMRVIAQKHGTLTLDDLLAKFGDHAAVLSMSAELDETIESALARLAADAVELVRSGAQCILLDDGDIFEGERLWLDPLLAVAAVDRALRENYTDEHNLRRRAGIVLRSGALRDLHDVVMAIAFGASAVTPYMLYAVALDIAPRPPRGAPGSEDVIKRIGNAVNALTIGIQKVTSTIGCHELRGYGQSFASVGLSSQVADLFGTPNYFGSHERGCSWGDLQRETETRAGELRAGKGNKLENPERLYPKMWKKVEDIALGEMGLDQYEAEMLELERDLPVSARHIIDLKERGSSIDPSEVDTRIGTHDLPVLIGAMSFGSQGELAYKAYAEAAARLNILCMNGEGGELPEVMGRYPQNRGNQIASARFGVNIEFLNSCAFLEIKIGQGAKPGEGGHLPGFKVTEQVALARSTAPWVDLISPSNNHDLYSIEDLAQLIDELKIANPYAKVSVKIPVVPGVGIIAVGIAKAGADIINIAGYEGGTGAARAHSLRHVGLPAEIGIWLAHRALIESGLRNDVELWVDGGMKSGRDVVKMMCLGANRVSFGTMAMVAVGCTICRKCHEGTCHVGITTHIKTKDEALEKGIKHFEPRDSELAVEGITRVFEVLGEDIRRWTAKLGFTRVQDLVGRADLLEQTQMHERIDLRPLFIPVPKVSKREFLPGVGRLLARPRNTMSKSITEIINDATQPGDHEMTYDDEQVMAMDRALGTHLAGAIQRGEVSGELETIHLRFSNSAVPGNGLAAFTMSKLDVLVEGGAQDGVGKCAKGGTIAVLKGLNHDGERLDGSVGKSFAYGAQGGRFIVQGDADTRACIRLSGADVVFGGEIKQPLHDDLGGLAARANLKGYACEYMTSGRVLVLGDPGPWLCAGMSGGTLYQRIQPEMNLTVEAVRKRIAKGATVEIRELDARGAQDVIDLLGSYISTLEANNQAEEVAHLYPLLNHPEQYFVMLAPPSRLKQSA